MGIVPVCLHSSVRNISVTYQDCPRGSQQQVQQKFSQVEHRTHYISLNIQQILWGNLGTTYCAAFWLSISSVFPFFINYMNYPPLILFVYRNIGFMTNAYHFALWCQCVIFTSALIYLTNLWLISMEIGYKTGVEIVSGTPIM